MKLTIKEAIKKITLIDKEIDKLLDFERREAKVIYLKDEVIEESKYDFITVTNEIDKLESKKREIKIKIGILNSTYKTSYNHLTIQELLIILAQKNQKLLRLETLSNTKKRQRKTTQDGNIEYIECRYEPEIVENEIDKLNNEIIDIQIAIDKANLEACIEI